MAFDPSDDPTRELRKQLAAERSAKEVEHEGCEAALLELRYEQEARQKAERELAAANARTSKVETSWALARKDIIQLEQQLAAIEAVPLIRSGGASSLAWISGTASMAATCSNARCRVRTQGAT